MTFWQMYMLAVLGILISVALPILKRALPRVAKDGLGDLWEVAKPYLAVGAFSLLTALLVIAFAGDTIKTWQAALLAGYAWDSTIQKVAT
jgi:hypothetical protein